MPHVSTTKQGTITCLPVYKHACVKNDVRHNPNLMETPSTSQFQTRSNPSLLLLPSIVTHTRSNHKEDI